MGYSKETIKILESAEARRKAGSVPSHGKTYKTISSIFSAAYRTKGLLAEYNAKK